MHRCFRLSLLFMLTGLARCATQPPLPAPQRPAAPQQSAPALPAPQQPVTAPRLPPAVSPQSERAGPFFTQTGLASFYGPAHAGKRTASGENFDHRDFTAAHRTLAFGTLVRVTNLSNGRTVTVRITDRGPHIKSRVIDISLAAAREIGMQSKGITRVRLEAFRADQPAQP
ncbi:MAG TPA: septal ring lytic transglycosylase RlpA family protein, partial [Rhizomicrobium sp.]|nr:septal ring lytic transglycosylase RlpA family protein [Rhizomicrobium sp.]